MEKRLEPFKFWCYKVLPLVYDDSLSYYELLCKVYDYCNKLGDAINSEEARIKEIANSLLELYDKFENLKDNLNVEQIVNEKLLEMLVSGALNDIINSRSYWASSGHDWYIKLFSDDSFEASGVDYHVSEFDVNYGNVYLSTIRRMPLPFPVTRDVFGFSGTASYYHGYITDVTLTNNVGVSYRLGFPENYTTHELTARLQMLGKRVAIPTKPTKAYNASAGQQAIAIAQTYVDAQLSGRKFAYGKNFFYNDSDIINNSLGEGMMECDTYMGLVIRGITYAQSPYNNTTPNYTFPYDELVDNPNNHSWCANMLSIIKENIFYGRDLKFAGEDAFGCWQIGGCIFSDMAEARPGDLVFWRSPRTKNWFDNISHVAMYDVEVIDGVEVPFVYEVTGASTSGGKVLHKRPFSERPDYCYFARICYS